MSLFLFKCNGIGDEKGPILQDNLEVNKKEKKNFESRCIDCPTCQAGYDLAFLWSKHNSLLRSADTGLPSCVPFFLSTESKNGFIWSYDHLAWARLRLGIFHETIMKYSFHRLHLLLKQSSRKKSSHSKCTMFSETFESNRRTLHGYVATYHVQFTTPLFARLIIPSSGAALSWGNSSFVEGESGRCKLDWRQPFLRLTFSSTGSSRPVEIRLKALFWERNLTSKRGLRYLCSMLKICGHVDDIRWIKIIFIKAAFSFHIFAKKKQETRDCSYLISRSNLTVP